MLAGCPGIEPGPAGFGVPPSPRPQPKYSCGRTTTLSYCYSKMTMNWTWGTSYLPWEWKELHLLAFDGPGLQSGGPLFAQHSRVWRLDCDAKNRLVKLTRSGGSLASITRSLRTRTLAPGKGIEPLPALLASRLCSLYTTPESDSVKEYGRGFPIAVTLPKTDQVETCYSVVTCRNDYVYEIGRPGLGFWPGNALLLVRLSYSPGCCKISVGEGGVEPPSNS